VKVVEDIQVHLRVVPEVRIVYFQASLLQEVVEAQVGLLMKELKDQVVLVGVGLLILPFRLKFLEELEHQDKVILEAMVLRAPPQRKPEVAVAAQEDQEEMVEVP
jgi:hypothetical protein